MTKSFKKIFLIIPCLLFLIQSCAEDPDPSLFTLIDPNAAVPVISSIEPSGQAIAGVTVVTINGSDFSNNASDLIVFFNGVPGVIESATSTQLSVKVPNVISDSVGVRIGKIDAEHFSNSFQYMLTPALAEVKKDAAGSDLFNEDIVPYGLTIDAQGNIYTSVVEFNIGTGIKKISPSGIIIPAGDMQDFAPKGGETSFNRLNMWQNNTIIGVRRVAAVFEITEGVAAKVFVSQGLTQAYDIDFDQNLNVWVGGRGLFRITPAKELKSFDYPDVIKSIRVFNNNFLYILTTVNGDDLLKRFPIISGDSLGAAEDILNISQSIQQSSGTALVEGTDFDIAADGDIILGTTRITDPIVVIHQDGSFESLYPGVIPQNTRVYAFAWSIDQYLYFTREQRDINGDGNIDLIQLIFRLDMQKQGAPHYGR